MDIEPLLTSHLSFAHQIWEEKWNQSSPPFFAVDATCGSGNDTQVLAQQLERYGGGFIYGIDLQPLALKKTSDRLSKFSFARVSFQGFCQSHATFPLEIPRGQVDLVVYNLGYLPSGERSFVTRSPSTIQSLENAYDLLCSDGMVSLTVYPGHEEGKEEENALLQWILKEKGLSLYTSKIYKKTSSPQAPQVWILSKHPA